MQATFYGRKEATEIMLRVHFSRNRNLHSSIQKMQIHIQIDKNSWSKYKVTFEFLHWCDITRYLSHSAHQTPNYTNPEHLVCLLFEYFFQKKVIKIHPKTHTLCNTLNWGNQNSGFVKLGVRWTEQDKSHEHEAAKCL